MTLVACRDRDNFRTPTHERVSAFSALPSAPLPPRGAASSDVAVSASALGSSTSLNEAPVASNEPGDDADSSLAQVQDGSESNVANQDTASGATNEDGAALSDSKLYSIAIETFVRARPNRSGKLLGYLRVGEAVRRSAESVSSDGCKDGWYAVEPMGYVCNGSAATLDPNAKLLTYAAPGARRGEPMPFAYAFVRPKVPHYYYVMPSEADIRRIEGADALASIRTAYQNPDPNLDVLGPPSDAPQDLLDGGRIPRPQGTAPRLRFKFHTGRAEPRTRVGISRWFEHNQRRWVITSQLDLVAMDRLRIVRPPTLRGVELQPGQQLPVGFVRPATATGYRYDESGSVSETVRLTRHQGFRLTGEKKQSGGKNLVATDDGLWIPEGQLTLVSPRSSVPTFVKSDTLRWLDISIRDQTLVAYQGKQPLYATLVSTGAGGMSDPETSRATPRGLFAIFTKHVTAKMSGDEVGAEYHIDDVPYVQYFHKGYALHAAFWHDNFGRVQSSGCVNLSPVDAAWVFEFTSPDVPKNWHGRYVKSGGTPVLIRP